MKFDALCDFVEEELLDIKKRVIQVENGEVSWEVGITTLKKPPWKRKKPSIFGFHAGFSGV